MEVTMAMKQQPGELLLLVDQDCFVSKDEGWWVQVPANCKDPLEQLIEEEEIHQNQED